MLKKILIALVVLIAAFAGYVAMQPDDLLIQRQATIAAPPAAVFEQVNDLKKWDAWSPWAKMDPKPRSASKVLAAGKDAAFTWSGNDKIGEGRMTIVDSRPAELGRHQGRLHQAVREHEQFEVRVQARGQPDAGHLEHGRQAELPREGDVHRLQRQEDDRRRDGKGTFQSEDRRREEPADALSRLSFDVALRIRPQGSECGAGRAPLCFRHGTRQR